MKIITKPVYIMKWEGRYIYLTSEKIVRAVLMIEPQIVLKRTINYNGIHKS
jgi:hypothetical protein